MSAAPNVDQQSPASRGASGNPFADESPDTRDGTLISFGITVEDHQAKRVTIQVFLAAVFIAAFSVVHFILGVLMGQYEESANNLGGEVVYRTDRLWFDTAGLIIELAIPAAGYLGALYHNRQLTCCFCSCNLFLVLVSSWSLLSVGLRLGELDGKCYMEAEPDRRALCWMWMENGAHKWVFLGDIAGTISLSFCAAIASIRLFRKLSREPANIDSNPVVGEVVQLRENTPLTQVVQARSRAPSGEEMPLYRIDRVRSGSDPDGTSPQPGRAVPRPSQQSIARPPSVRIEMAPPEVQEDEYY